MFEIDLSGLVAPLLVLLGALLTLREAERRFDRQLTHERSEKQKDRLAGARKDVYSKLAEDIVNFEFYLANRILNDSIDKDGYLEPWRLLGASAARTSSICSYETKTALSALMVRYGEVMLEVPVLVRSYQEHQASAQLRVEELDRISAERSRLLQAIRTENESGQPSPPRFEALNRAFDFQQQRSREVGEDLDSINTLKVRAHAAYGARIVEILEEIEPLRTQLEYAINAEHDLLSQASPAAVVAGRARMLAQARSMIKRSKE